ncbi:MAG: ABC transporter substrate-binding protein [Bacteriovoracaceae bacterium]|nr:ABC transporter substrate-binding protein [Bacteriovoracaceae bacterium]
MKISNLIILLLTLLLSACRWNQEKSLVIPLRTEVLTIDPHLSYDLNSNLITYQIYDTLYSYHYLKRPLTHEPLIAEDFPQLLNDGITYQVKIKKNIYYHPGPFIPEGRQVRAQDFVNSFKRLAYGPTNSKGWWLVQDKFVGLDDFRLTTKKMDDLLSHDLKSIEATDDHTLLIHLKRPLGAPLLMGILSMPFTAPIPIEVFTKMNNDLTKYEVGTGAYALEDFDVSERIHLKAFNQYLHQRYPNTGDRNAHDKGLLADANRPLPMIKNVEIVIVKDDEKIWKKFLDDQYSFIDLPREKHAEVIDINGSLSKSLSNKWVLDENPAFYQWFVEFNMQDDVVGKNLNLRKAISYAINYDSFMSEVTRNADQKANSVMPPGVFGYNPASELPYKYDPKKAMDLLKKIKWDSNKILKFETRKDSTTNILFANFIKKDLEKVGIKVEVIVNNFSTFLEKAKKKKMQLWQGGWLLDYPDAENVLQLFYSPLGHENGPNKSQFKNAEFDRLFHEILVLDNGPERFQKLQQMEAIIHKELPIIMLYFSKNYFLVNQQLKNFRFNDISPGFFKYLRWQ